MIDEKILERKQNCLKENGYCEIGFYAGSCRKCNSISTSSWSNYKAIRVLCSDCGWSYFIPVAGKRVSSTLYKWSLEVRERDGFMCRKCGSREKLNAHHIKPFADFPELRFDINNGITLCEDCHKKEHKK